MGDIMTVTLKLNRKLKRVLLSKPHKRDVSVDGFLESIIDDSFEGREAEPFYQSATGRRVENCAGGVR